MEESIWLDYTLPLYVETVVAAAVLTVGLLALRSGRWAALAVAAGVLWLVPQAVYVATDLEWRLADDISLGMWLEEHHVLTVLRWMQLIGLVLVVPALAVGRLGVAAESPRTPPTDLARVRD